jgi:hypothetical protein
LRAVLALGLLLFGTVGCSLWSPSSEPVSASPAGRSEAIPLLVSEWTRGILHCDDGACARWYRVDIAEPGALRIDVYAASGESEPDFDVRLEDETGGVLWGFAPTGVSPRKLERRLGPGVYYLLLESIGDRGGRLAFEALTTFVPNSPVLRPGTGAKAPGRPSLAIARGPEIWVSAEIVQVEGQGGVPSVLVLDAGARDQLQPGQRGELLDGGVVIATFELVDVDTERSRARLDGAPSDIIRYESRVRVRVPIQ